MNRTRCYAVNFLNLYYGRTGTVEYRMSPASKGPFEALGWIELFTAFTRALNKRHINMEMCTVLEHSLVLAGAGSIQFLPGWHFLGEK
jgi:hypothetical protein